MVGSSFIGLFDAGSVVGVRASLEAAGGPASNVTLRGARGPVSLTLRVVPGDAGGHRVAILRDGGTTSSPIADIDRASVEGTWKADFLAKVSHEIRTPMNGILGFTDVMLKEQFGSVGNDRYRDYLRDIHASGEHVVGLVNDLVDLARIEAGRFEMAFGPVSLNELVSSCVTLLQPQAAREQIVVRTSFSADLRTLLVDERSMRQAALNILANAIRFTEAGGQVIVSTTIAERGEVALRVRDTGIGMSSDEVEAALEPFRQVTVSSPRRGGGTGLGLPLTKALVEANHGRFRITSRKDEGTLVEMLPSPPGKRRVPEPASRAVHSRRQTYRPCKVNPTRRVRAGRPPIQAPSHLAAAHFETMRRTCQIVLCEHRVKVRRRGLSLLVKRPKHSPSGICWLNLDNMV